MRKQTKFLLIASALVTSLVAAPVLLAHENSDHGMMGRDGMMGNGGMMGMMEHYSQIMGDDARHPSDQWRNIPPAPGKL